MQNPKYFTAVAVSPSAIMKMMMHCSRGVEKGIKKGGKPTEVMGLLLGRPDPSSPTTLIVTDAFPLPIEGFETRVVADDQVVVNHMINLNESLEKSRSEKFMGWYHSHPFELGDHSHCFLSQTDLSTQLQWQRAEDPHGNPFVAIVLDPLRATHQGLPELKAFRAFPPEFQSPIAYECPDGKIEPIERQRLELWGSCWNRYYELKIDYYMSSTSRAVLQALTSEYLWISNLKKSIEPRETLEQLQNCQASAMKVFSVGTTTATVAGTATTAVATTTTASATATTTTTTTTASTASGASSGTTTSARDAMVIDSEATRSTSTGEGSGGTSTTTATTAAGTTATAAGKDATSSSTPGPLSQLVDSLNLLSSQELAQTTLNHERQRVFSTTIRK